MNVVLLCRDSWAGRQLAAHLAARNLLSGIVVETGRTAKRRKVKRMMRVRPWWRVPLRVLDLLAISIYTTIVNVRLHRAGPPSTSYPDSLPIRFVDDVNDAEAVSWIEERAADILVVHGTSILRQPLLRLPRKYVLNIHGGILPQYRNVHSDFWAMKWRDYGRLGTTIVYLDEGIDTGDVALKRTVPVEPHDTIVSVKRKNLTLAQELIEEALGLARDDRLPRTAQEPAASGFYPTPGFVDIVTFVARRRYRSSVAAVARDPG